MSHAAGIVRSGIPVLRWFTRLLSFVTIVVLLLFLTDDFDAGRIKPTEWVGLLFFPFGIMIGLAIGWLREGLGGLVVVLSLLGFYSVSLLLTGKFPGFAFAVFSLPGLLFLLCWLIRLKHVRS